MSGLLRLVREHADAVEADFRWRYHLSNRDLSWRERVPLIRHLPDDGAVANVLRGDQIRWTLTDHLLDDVRMWLMGLAGVEARNIKPHPQRPYSRKTVDPARHKKLIELRARRLERARQIAAGEIT